MTLRQTSPHIGGPLGPPAAGVSTPVAMPAGSQKSNLERLREATPHVVMPTPLSRDAHPGPKFWNSEREWIAWREAEKEKGSFRLGVQGGGINSSWMEDENGNRVNLNRQQKILAEARRTWITMAAWQIPTAVYGGVDSLTLDYFRAKMELEFPELRLCADHWKTDQLWRENFSSWDIPRSTKGPQEMSRPELRSRKASRFQSRKSTF